MIKFLLRKPFEEYFPTYTKAMFVRGNGTMVLSAGLGSSHSVLRVNNASSNIITKIAVYRRKGLRWMFLTDSMDMFIINSRLLLRKQ